MPERCNDRSVTAITTVLCDLDGVVWLAHQPIPGSVEAIAALRASGCRVLFVTNNSAPRLADHEAALAAIGVDAAGGVVTSSMAAAHLVDPNWRVLVAGGPGVVEAVERRGATVVVNDGSPLAEPVDAVIVGLHRDVDYPRLAVASSAVRDGARFIATNDDSTYPTPQGLLPGGGAIVAAIATASGTPAVVAGKPHAPMAALVRAMLSAGDRVFDPGSVVMVGDRLDTDGALAAQLGCHFALVRSGVTTAGDVVVATSPVVPPPPVARPVTVHFDVADLAALTSLVTTA